jgi:Zn-finger nucleic acid-binding protein
MSERQGVEIDYCPKCRGVWLDRGELDKVIEKSAAEMAPPPARAAESRGYDPRHERPRRYDDDDHKYRHGYYKKRKSILGEIFDF